MDYIILALVILFAIVDWLAVEKKSKKIEYIAKPGVMVFLIIWLVQRGGLSGWMIWFVVGAIFSLGGDIFLMLPGNYFLAGLISFFLAHVAYVIGFNQTFPPVTVPGVIILILIAITGWQTYNRIAAGLEVKELSRLKIPILVYILVISLMTLSAMQTLLRVEWRLNQALLVSLGGILFFVSDFILAWDRFVSPVSHARLKTMITYHLSQGFILTGAAIHFLG